MPKVALSAGVGIVNVANASAYGELTNRINLNKNKITAAILGEAGISLKLLGFEYKHPIWEANGGQGYTYYDSSKKQKSISMGSVYKDILNKDSYIISEKTDSTSYAVEDNSNPNIKTLLSGCNSAAGPKVVSFSNNKALMIYIEM